jgi:acetyltransferase-like isoleucine patch superfamily enzyme
LITIEDDVSLAGGVYILTHSNPTTPLREILGPSSHVVKPVHIKKGAWITLNVVILPGVTIGENAIVSTGSVVRKDVAPYTIVGGNPAKFIANIKRTQVEEQAE